MLFLLLHISYTSENVLIKCVSSPSLRVEVFRSVGDVILLIYACLSAFLVL